MINATCLEKCLRALALTTLSLILGVSLAAQPGTIKWSFQTGGDVQSSPTIGPEGVIYVGSDDGNLYAINPDGSQKWAFPADGEIVEPPAIDEDGIIYATDDTGKLHAVNPDGSLRWTFTPASPGPPSEMALAETGTIFYAVGSDYYAVNLDGSQLWTMSRPTEGPVTGLSIGQDSVLFSNTLGRLIAFSPLSGAEQWLFMSGFGGSDVGTAVGEDGTLYFGQRTATGDNFYATNPDGSLLWKVGLDAEISAGPAIAVDGTLYVPIDFKVLQGKNQGLLLALDPQDGGELWRYETDGGVSTVPAVGFDGTIYLTTSARKLIALRPDGSELWSFEPGGTNRVSRSAPTIGEDGTLYYGSNDRLYAVCGSSPGPAPSAWPMARHDVRNTGRFGSEVSRRRWFAPQVYWLDAENNAVVTISNIGEITAGPAEGEPAGLGATRADFRIDVLDRDGSVLFSIAESVDPGETKEIVLESPESAVYIGAAIIDASIKDGSFLAPHLTWNLDVSESLEPLAIGAFFSDPTDAAQAHHFPAKASARNGLGIGVMNIGKNEIACLLKLFNSDGTLAADQTIDLGPEASVVQFFNDLVLAGSSPQGSGPSFSGRGAFTCDAPVVAVAVTQDFSNGGFPTDRITIKGF